MSAAARQRPSPGELFLDHVSHFVRDLRAASEALEALGFCVTPRSDQQTQDGPAGTANVCVMLEDGYLEFLAPTADTPNAARMRASMARHDGVHLACFGTPAAEEELARLGWHGFDPQPIVALERPVEIDGVRQTARFKVVRAAPDRMPEGRVQFVEHLTPQALWQPRWLSHANRVERLACVFVVADDAVEVAARWARFCALLPQPAGAFVHLETGRGHVLVGTRAAWAAIFGDAPHAPALCGYALECSDPDALAARFAKAGGKARRLRDNLHIALLPAALGGMWVFGTRDALAFPTQST
jgi:hypothetical protein